MFSFRKNRMQFLPVIMILLFALALSACGGGNTNGNNDTGSGTSIPNTGADANATVVNVSMTTYAFQVDNPNIPAGPVTFHVTNDATDMEHEMVVLKTDIAGSDLPTNADGVVEEDQFESLGEVEGEVGESKDLTVNLDPGHYVLLCNVPGHYANGMVLDINVQ